MNEFTLLRNRAREQRDKAIAQAKSTYETALNQILELESLLLDRGKPKVKRVSDCIGGAIPTDRPFTVEDVTERLQAEYPERIWSKNVVCTQVTRMRQRGVLYRVSRAKVGHPAVYAAKGVEAPARAFGDLSLSEVMDEMLTEPMRPVELAVRVLESGYETSMDRTNTYMAFPVKRAHVERG